MVQVVDHLPDAGARPIASSRQPIPRITWTVVIDDLCVTPLTVDVRALHEVCDSPCIGTLSWRAIRVPPSVCSLIGYTRVDAALRCAGICYLLARST
jgi:hypothetical protein